VKDLQQQVAYLQGLAKGIEIDKSKEGKLIAEILDLLEDMTEQMAIMIDEQTDLEDYLESIDNDLSDLEDDFYEENDECCCDEDDSDDYVDVECPNCHEEVCFDSAILYDDDMIEVTCPNCGAVVFCNDGDEENKDEVYDLDKDDDDDKKKSKKEKK